jgi:ribosomal protein S27E
VLSRGSRRPRAPPFLDPPGYARHRPETTLLYRLVEQHYPSFRELRAESGRPLPGYAEQEFEAYLKCGRLEHGFLRVRCGECHAAKLVAFSCKRRGFCPSCGARRMAEAAALLVDEVLPARPLRQWVLSLPHALRFLLATNPAALTEVLGVVYLPAAGGPPVFRHLPAPTGAQLQVVVQRIAERVGHVLERRGLVERGVGAAKHPPADPAKLGRRITWR